MKKTGVLRKLSRLQSILAGMGRCLVGFSGGVDSTFLLAACRETLGGNVLAVSAASAFFPVSELRQAKLLARKIKVRHVVLGFEPPASFWDNPHDRCYICKKALFRKLRAVAQQKGFGFVLDGSNADDLKDDRPGEKALRELGIRSPLAEAGLTKRQIRLLSRSRRLATWDKEPLSCLATRVPFGSKITPEKLKMIGQAESCLRKLGVRVVRVRHHGPIARIETDTQGFSRIIRDRERISRRLQKLGFAHVTADLAGYCRGRPQKALPWKNKK